MPVRTFAAVLGLGLLASAPAAAQPDSWVTVAPPLADFVVKMPGQPERSVDGAATRYLYTDAGRAERALVTGVTVEGPIPLGQDMDAAVQASVDGFIRAWGQDPSCRTVSRARHDYPADGPTLPAYPGVMAKLECDRAAALLAVYAVQRRVYSVGYMAAKARYSQTEAEQYLKSFTLLRH